MTSVSRSNEPVATQSGSVELKPQPEGPTAETVEGAASDVSNEGAKAREREKSPKKQYDQDAQMDPKNELHKVSPKHLRKLRNRRKRKAYDLRNSLHYYRAVSRAIKKRAINGLEDGLYFTSNDTFNEEFRTILTKYFPSTALEVGSRGDHERGGQQLEETEQVKVEEKASSLEDVERFDEPNPTRRVDMPSDEVARHDKPVGVESVSRHGGTRKADDTRIGMVLSGREDSQAGQETQTNINKENYYKVIKGSLESLRQLRNPSDRKTYDLLKSLYYHGTVYSFIKERSLPSIALPHLASAFKALEDEAYRWQRFTFTPNARIINEFRTVLTKYLPEATVTEKDETSRQVGRQLEARVGDDLRGSSRKPQGIEKEKVQTNISSSDLEAEKTNCTRAGMLSEEVVNTVPGGYEKSIWVENRRGRALKADGWKMANAKEDPQTEQDVPSQMNINNENHYKTIKGSLESLRQLRNPENKETHGLLKSLYYHRNVYGLVKSRSIPLIALPHLASVFKALEDEAYRWQRFTFTPNVTIIKEFCAVLAKYLPEATKRMEASGLGSKPAEWGNPQAEQDTQTNINNENYYKSLKGSLESLRQLRNPENKETYDLLKSLYYHRNVYGFIKSRSLPVIALPHLTSVFKALENEAYRWQRFTFTPNFTIIQEFRMVLAKYLPKTTSEVELRGSVGGSGDPQAEQDTQMNINNENYYKILKGSLESLRQLRNPGNRETYDLLKSLYYHGKVYGFIKERSLPLVALPHLASVFKALEDEAYRWQRFTFTPNPQIIEEFHVVLAKYLPEAISEPGLGSDLEGSSRSPQKAEKAKDSDKVSSSKELQANMREEADTQMKNSTLNMIGCEQTEVLGKSKGQTFEIFPPSSTTDHNGLQQQQHLSPIAASVAGISNESNHSPVTQVLDSYLQSVGLPTSGSGLGGVVAIAANSPHAAPQVTSNSHNAYDLRRQPKVYIFGTVNIKSNS